MYLIFLVGLAPIVTPYKDWSVSLCNHMGENTGEKIFCAFFCAQIIFQLIFICYFERKAKVDEHGNTDYHDIDKFIKKETLLHK